MAMTTPISNHHFFSPHTKMGLVHSVLALAIITGLVLGIIHYAMPESFHLSTLALVMINATLLASFFFMVYRIKVWDSKKSINSPQVLPVNPQDNSQLRPSSATIPTTTSMHDASATSQVADLATASVTPPATAMVPHEIIRVPVGCHYKFAAADGSAGDSHIFLFRGNKNITVVPAAIEGADSWGIYGLANRSGIMLWNRVTNEAFSTERRWKGVLSDDQLEKLLAKSHRGDFCIQLARWTDLGGDTRTLVCKAPHAISTGMSNYKEADNEKLNPLLQPELVLELH